MFSLKSTVNRITKALTTEDLNVGLDKKSVFVRELKLHDRVIHNLASARGVIVDVGTVKGIPTLYVRLENGRIISGHRQEFRLVERSIVAMAPTRRNDSDAEPAPIEVPARFSGGYAPEGHSLLDEIA